MKQERKSTKSELKSVEQARWAVEEEPCSAMEVLRQTLRWMTAMT
jgi:hypothetical protein